MDHWTRSPGGGELSGFVCVRQLCLKLGDRCVPRVFTYLKRTKMHVWRSYILGGELISDYLCICLPHRVSLCVFCGVNVYFDTFDMSSVDEML